MQMGPGRTPGRHDPGDANGKKITWLEKTNRITVKVGPEENCLLRLLHDAQGVCILGFLFHSTGFFNRAEICVLQQRRLASKSYRHWTLD